jgi:shikimate dehydrogenase
MTQPLRFAFFCHPKAQSWLPGMYRLAFRRMRISHTYETVDIPDLVRLETMVDTIRQGVLSGANVAAPYKVPVLNMVDRVDASAELVGAANVLTRDGKTVVAHSTEASALADDLRLLGASGHTSAVIGSNEAALAAVAACAQVGAKVVAVTSQAWTSSEELVAADTAERFRSLGALPCTWPGARAEAATTKMSEVLRLHWPDIAAGSGLVLQATAAGLRSNDPAAEAVAEIVPWSRLKKDAFAYDLVYTPRETPFLRTARHHGLRAAGGLGMLVGQGAHALSLWLNVKPDLDLMRLAAEQALLVGH